jgi:nicotinamidase-related amidase
MVKPLEIDPVRTALVLLDLQNYNVHPAGYWNEATPGAAKLAEPMIEGTVRALDVARAAGIAVIHVANSWREGHPDANVHAPWMRDAKAANRSIDGTWGVEFFEPVAPREGEFVIYKRSVSAFVGTELERLLLVRDINTLVLAGGVTNFVVEGTARHASDLGYRVVVLEDCTASVNDEWQAFSIGQILPLIGEVATTADLQEALSARQSEKGNLRRPLATEAP